MTRTIACCVAIAILALSQPNRADAAIGPLTLVNKTTTSAWITVYGSYGGPWDVVTSFCLPEGKIEATNVAKGRKGISEMKIRAEMKHRSDCLGPTLYDTSDTRISPGGIVSAWAVVEVGDAGKFRVVFR